MYSNFTRKFSTPLVVLSMAAALALAGCGDDNTGSGNNGGDNNGGVTDAGTDTGTEDTGTEDTGTEDTNGCTETNGGVEICDGVDNDCDGEIDEDADDTTTYYTDGDDDGFGDDASAVEACEQPADTITEGGDCDDTDAAINPDADEVCDGVDNDCDSDIDTANVVAQNCAVQEGVCSGAQTATCDSGSYAACAASDFGPDYVDDSEESWMCDGLDNNCDGTADEVCCGVAGNNSEPTAVKLGDGSDYVAFDSFGPSHPTVIDAVSGAPAGATSLVVWDESQTSIAAQYIDETGAAVGTKYTKSVSNATAATVVATPQGYDLIWGEVIEMDQNSDGDYTIEVQPLDASLQENGSSVVIQYEQDTLRELDSISAAYHDRGVLIGTKSTSLAPGVGAVMYRIDDRANSPQTLDLGGGGFFGRAYVRAVSTDSGLLMTWYESGGTSGDPAFHGKLYSSTGVASGSFEVSYPDQDDGQYDVFQTAADVIMVVFPEDRGSNNALVAATINLSSGAKIDKIDLTSSTANHLSPSIVGRDTDSDGYPDATTVVWVIESNTSTTLVGSSFDAQNPSTMASNSTIGPNVPNLDNSDIAATGPGAVAVWQTRTLDDIKAAPLSYEGPGICN